MNKTLIDGIVAVDAMLPRAIDEGCAFANGGGYIQHTHEAVQVFLEATQRLFNEHTPTLAGMFRENPRGIVGRYLDDNNSPLYYLYGRISRIDGQHREWGQPYFVLNPGKAKNVLWPYTGVAKLPEWVIPKELVITVRGGVAEVTSNPAGWPVRIVDHDNEEKP